MYKLSLIINTFNSENKILKLFNSILNQTISFEFLEILFVDLNSSDNTKIILESFSNKYSNVSYYTFPNSNEGYAKNFGLNKAQAPYVMFINSNNYLFEDGCDILYDIISNNKTNIVAGNYIKVTESGFSPNIIENKLKKGYIKINGNNYKKNILKINLEISSIIFDKKYLTEHKIKFNENIRYPDLVFITQSFLTSDNAIFVNRPLIEKYEIDYTKCLSNKKNKKRLINLVDTYEIFFNILNKNNVMEEKLILPKVENWIDEIISNDFSSHDLYDLFVKSHFFMNKCFNVLETVHDKKHLLIQLIASKDYLLAIDFINLYKMKDNIDIKINERDIFFLFYGYDYNIGGLAKAVLNRANLLSNKGLNITLLNMDPYSTNVNPNFIEFIGDDFKNIQNITDNFRKMDYLGENVKFINIIDYFRDLNADNDNVKHCKNEYSFIEITDEMIIQKINKENLDVYDYYFKDDFKSEMDILLELIEEPISDKIKTTKLSDIFNKTPSKSEIYRNNTLFFETIKNNGETVEEQFYTPDGFKFLKIFKDEKVKYMLFEKKYNSKIIFESLQDFCDYFVTKVCMSSDNKPFLINDCSGPIPSFNNVSGKIAYKIGNLHTNPYREPTYGHGSQLTDVSILYGVENMDALVTLTKTEKENLMADFERYPYIYDIPNLINLEEIRELDTKHFTKKVNHVSFFTRISSEKNISDAIKAFKIVIKSHPHAILNIYGRALKIYEKNEYNRLKKLIEELDLEKNVVFKGHITNPYEKMRESLATLLVSKLEGLPMVIIESMANKTPMICYDLNFGPKDMIINSKTGYVVEKNNVEQLAEKIIYLLDNPEIAIKMGENAQKSIFEKLNSDLIYNSWMNLFKETIINSKINNICKLSRVNTIKQSNNSTNNNYDQLIAQQNDDMQVKNSELLQSEKDLINVKQLVTQQKDNIILKNNEIESTKELISKQEKIITNHFETLKNKSCEYENILFEKKKELISYVSIIRSQSNVIEDQFNTLKSFKLKDEENIETILNLSSEIEYYKHNTGLLSKLFIPLPYFVIICNHENIIQNIKLYRTLRNSEWFDKGYYIKNNSDLSNKWFKYLNPELHFTCYGFKEKRKPNSNYDTKWTKMDIIKEISDDNV